MRNIVVFNDLEEEPKNSTFQQRERYKENHYILNALRYAGHFITVYGPFYIPVYDRFKHFSFYEPPYDFAVVTDISKEDNLNLFERMKREFPKIRIVVCTSEKEKDFPDDYLTEKGVSHVIRRRSFRNYCTIEKLLAAIR